MNLPALQDTALFRPSNRLGRSALILFSALWAAVVLTAYYRVHMPPFSGRLRMVVPLFAWSPSALWHAGAHLLLVVSIVSAVVLQGRWLTRTFFSQPSTALDHMLISFGLGCGAVMGVLLGLGLLGLWYRPWILTLFVLAAFAAVLSERTRLFQFPAAPLRAWWGAHRLLEKILIFVLGVQVIVYGFHALAPEISYDALVYHLGLPALWGLEHKIRPVPSNCFSGAPLNIEMLYGLVLWAGDAVVAKGVNFAFGLGVLGLLYAIGRRYGSRLAGLGACLIFLSSPVVALEFVRASVDLGTVFFALLAGYAFVLAAQQPPPRRSRGLILSGIFCGLAMGSKYMCWVLLPALGLVSAMGKERARSVVLTLASACAVVSPWVLKNMVFFKNTLYPFLHHFFVPPAGALAHWDIFLAETMHDPRFFLGSWQGVMAYLFQPWTATMGTSSAGNYLGPAYLLSLPALYFLPRSLSLRQWTWLFAVQWFVLSFLTYMPRYWLPVLAFGAVLMGISLVDGVPSLAIRRTAIAALAIIGLINLYGIHGYLLRTEGWKVVVGQMSKAEYLNNAHLSYLSPYYGAAEFINHDTPPSSRVILLGDSRGYYLQRPYLGASLVDIHPLFMWAQDSVDGEALYRKVVQAGFTHMLFNAAEAARVRESWMGDLTEHNRAVIDGFWKKHLLELLNDSSLQEGKLRSAFVYQIVEKVDRPAPDILLQIFNAS